MPEFFVCLIFRKFLSKFKDIDTTRFQMDQGGITPTYLLGKTIYACDT
jgi:hypothetical protein